MGPQDQTPAPLPFTRHFRPPVSFYLGPLTPRGPYGLQWEAPSPPSLVPTPTCSPPLNRPLEDEMRQGSHHPRGKQSLVQMKDQPPVRSQSLEAPAQVRPAPPAADVLGGLQSGVQETRLRPSSCRNPPRASYWRRLQVVQASAGVSFYHHVFKNPSLPLFHQN